MGLRSGDLLLNINDNVIDGPEDARSMFETIQNENDVNLKVRRCAAPTVLICK
jgi:type II secretory pathway component PulC